MDCITIKNLRVTGNLGADHWQVHRNQVLVFNIWGYLKFNPVDDMNGKISYSVVAKHIQKLVETSKIKTLESLADKVALDCLELGLNRIIIKLEKTNALLHAASVGIHIERTSNDLQYLKETCAGTIPTVPTPLYEDSLTIKDLSLQCIIGVNPCERIEKQKVIINLRLIFKPEPWHPKSPLKNNYNKVAKNVMKFVDSSNYKTLEAMGEAMADIIIYQCDVDRVIISIDKPSALVFAETAGIQIERIRNSPKIKNVSSQIGHLNTVFLAVGTNTGNRYDNIKQALNMLKKRNIIIQETSFLYESQPMYVLDQPKFLNAALKIETSLSPLDLLDTLKSVEKEMGRDFCALRNGPRIIDLDILLYDSIEFHNERLTIPHIGIPERFFVLVPLADLIPDFYHPTLGRTISQLLELLKNSEVEQEALKRVFPIRNDLWDFSNQTYVMGILNVTPDSFSDGGKSNTVETALLNALDMAKYADMIDVGGQSTAPLAHEISEDEEIERVIPVIKEIRKHNQSIPISVDTYRARVAELAIAAGADLINDVSGGSRDPNMLKIMSTTGAPVCLMHMRGNSSTMTSLTDYAGDLVLEIRNELSRNVNAAIESTIYRWNIIIDPGIGFAKNSKQNYEILKHLNRFSDNDTKLAELPILIGVSRKRFIGETTKKEIPMERIWGTAAATAISIVHGAAIVRVHDVKEMKDVVLVSNELK